MDFNKETMQTITCSDKHFITACKMLTELEEDFDIGYSKNVGSKVIEIQCYNEDFDKLVSKIYKLNNEVAIKISSDSGFMMVDKDPLNNTAEK